MSVELLADLITKVIQHKDVESRIVIYNNIKYIQERAEGVLEPIDDLIQSVLNLADGELITSEGGCNWTNHKKLEQFGYKVTRGEFDSFGWLSGIINTPIGRIVYG